MKKLVFILFVLLAGRASAQSAAPTYPCEDYPCGTKVVSRSDTSIALRLSGGDTLVIYSPKKFGREAELYIKQGNVLNFYTGLWGAPYAPTYYLDPASWPKSREVSRAGFKAGCGIRHIQTPGPLTGYAEWAIEGAGIGLIYLANEVDYRPAAPKAARAARRK